MRNPAFNKLIDEIVALHESKNSDYASDADPLSNFRKCEAFGVPAWKGILIRMSDKWSRLEQLASGKIPQHESLRDSLIDTAVYSLLCVIALEQAASTSASSAVEPSSLPLCQLIPDSSQWAISEGQRRSGS